MANAAEVHLEDGSVIVGSIISLEDGEDLVVDTKHMDEVVIEWASVTQVRNTEVVDIELFDGRRYAGKLRRDGADIALEGVSTIQLTARTSKPPSAARQLLTNRLTQVTLVGPPLPVRIRISSTTAGRRSAAFSLKPMSNRTLMVEPC